jgi:hypothetical protein
MLRRLSICHLALVLAPVCMAGAAEPPVLSGVYDVTLAKICPAAVAQGEDQALQLTAGGSIAQIFGQANFLPRAGTVDLDAVVTAGDLVRLQGAGKPEGQHRQQSSAGFAVTASTLTLGPDTYQARFGKLSKGIAALVVIGGLDGSGCSEQGLLIRRQ